MGCVGFGFIVTIAYVNSRNLIVWMDCQTVRLRSIFNKVNLKFTGNNDDMVVVMDRMNAY